MTRCLGYLDVSPFKKSGNWLNIFFFFLKIYLRGEGREKNINVWLPLERSLLWTWPTTQPCALTGNQTGDLWFTGRHSVHWATPARARYILIGDHLTLKSLISLICFPQSHPRCPFCWPSGLFEPDLSSTPRTDVQWELLCSSSFWLWGHCSFQAQQHSTQGRSQTEEAEESEEALPTLTLVFFFP